MVKADLTRDYYGDLELQPGASDNEIKKQFRALALKYHPDRNPGREAEVNSKFQTIQSAHEVLLDPEQRAKYDTGRVRNSGGARTYGGFQPTPTATPSGTRGNPWANAGSQWAPPPKPPPPREFERRKAPPPSAGARRYANFTANGTVPKADPDAEARRKNYEAWESMKQPQSQSRTYQPPKPPKPVPKEYTPQSGREESNSYKHPPPPKSSKPGYDEFRAGTSSSHSDRTSPTRPSRKSGFMPSTPGPDEPPASSSSAYFSRAAGRTPSRRQANVPEPPSRPVPPADPLRQFREQTGTPYEPRLSTPYATHGGEKTNPFENINLNRSRSTRVPLEKTNSSRMEPPRANGPTDRHRSASPPRTKHHRNLSPEPGIARADSEINLGASPKRTFSSANRPNQPSPSSRPHSQRFASVDLNSSSDGDDSDSGSDKRQSAFGTRARTFAKRRANPNAARPPTESQGPSGGPESSTGENEPRPRKPSLAEFRQWWSAAEGKERNELNDVNLDGTSNNRGNASHDDTAQENPSMYATLKRFTSVDNLGAKTASSLPTIDEERFSQSTKRRSPLISTSFATSSEAYAAIKKKLSDMVAPMIPGYPSGSPSGAPVMTPPGSLTPFEATQRKVVEHLVRHNGLSITLSEPTHDIENEQRFKDMGAQIAQSAMHHLCNGLQDVQSIGSASTLSTQYKIERTEFSECPCGCGEMGNPFRKQGRGAMSSSTSSYQAEPLDLSSANSSIDANKQSSRRFSFNVNDDTPQPPKPAPASFSSSAENISTKFTAEDWHGKFEAGDYFANDGTNANKSSRTRSGSRSRNRSPVKGWVNRKSQGPPVPNIDPEILQQTTDSEPISSPGGTKFTPEEWARTFKPQNFAPPPYQGSGVSTRPPLRNARRSRTGSSATKPVTTSKTAGTAAMVDEDESSESPLEMGKRTTRSVPNSQDYQAPPLSSVDSPNAMDIDPPLDEHSDTPKARRNGFTASNNPSNEPRNVPVEPSRPEWRAGGTSGATGSDVPPNVAQHPVPPPRSGNRNSQQTAKSADEEDFKTNFEDLKNVEPMHHPATGLHSFSDLTSNLPFPSRAAAFVTMPRNFATGELDLPNPPRAPMVPPVTNGTRPQFSTWESYLVAFKAYMAEWDIFNTKMIMHFVARKNQVDAMKPGWLEAFGDSDLDKYTEGMIEDLKVRAHWDVACERHQAAMEGFRKFKSRTRA